MLARLGTLYLAQKAQAARSSSKKEKLELDGGRDAKIDRPSDFQMFIRLRIVVCGMLAAVTGVIAAAG